MPTRCSSDREKSVLDWAEIHNGRRGLLGPVRGRVACDCPIRVASDGRARMPAVGKYQLNKEGRGTFHPHSFDSQFVTAHRQGMIQLDFFHSPIGRRNSSQDAIDFDTQARKAWRELEFGSCSVMGDEKLFREQETFACTIAVIYPDPVGLPVACLTFQRVL